MRASKLKPLPQLPLDSFPLSPNLVSPSRYYASASSSGQSSPQSTTSSATKSVELEEVTAFPKYSASKASEITIRAAEPGKTSKLVVLVDNKPTMECKQGRINRKTISESRDVREMATDHSADCLFRN